MTESILIRVMLVDDHAVVRSGLGAVLTAFDDLELVAEAGSGEETVQLCEEAQPDVVLMDLVMPGMDGAAATKAIREKCSHIQVIALTSFKEQDLVEGALQAGASGGSHRAIRGAHRRGFGEDQGQRDGAGVCQPER